MTAPWRERLNDLQLDHLSDMFTVDKPIIGMVHLWPMPGAPGYDGYGMEAIIERAVEDAETLVEGGVDGIIVENMWDLPYYVGTDTPLETMTCQSVAARKVVETVDVPVGINIVHNGGVVELAIAVASGADFIRVCVLSGARLWDTGELDGGCASDLLRKRKALDAEHIKLIADVDKKHSIPFPGLDLATHIEWTEFYLADALIASGQMTGAPPDVGYIREAKELASKPLLLGSGTSADNVAEFLEIADGAIVGSWIKVDGIAENPVDLERVRRYMDAAESAR